MNIHHKSESPQPLSLPPTSLVFLDFCSLHIDLANLVRLLHVPRTLTLVMGIILGPPPYKLHFCEPEAVALPKVTDHKTDAFHLTRQGY